jgi:hypothetical protein
MDALVDLKSRWNNRTDGSEHALLEEYGTFIASWLLGHLDQESDVTSVISDHLLSNDQLLDQCGWEIIPLLYRREWMLQNTIIDKVFNAIPTREIILHTLTSFETYEASWKLSASIRLLRLLPKLLSVESKRPVIDILTIATHSIPTRYVTASDIATVSEGSIYGVSSAEDTSLAGQKVHPDHKASLHLFLKPILAELSSFITENLPQLSQDTLFVNATLSCLFRLGHSTSSFRQSVAESNLPATSIPLPPVLQPPTRPQIKPDLELEALLEDATRQIVELVQLCGFTSLNLLNYWNYVSNKRIRSAGTQEKDSFSTNIEIPAISTEIADFNQFGVCACLFETMTPSIPYSWILLNPSNVLELLLSHARAALTSRAVYAPLFVMRLLAYHPPFLSHDISYPIEYILENEILPARVAHKAYFVVKGLIEFGIRMPDTRLRQASFASISGIISLFDANSRYKLIYLIATTCPYPSAQSLMILLMKESWLTTHSVACSSATPSSNSSFLSTELFTEFLAKEALKINGMEQRYDSVLAALNFLRAILLRDSKPKICAIWKPENLTYFKKQVMTPLNAAILQVVAQHQKDDSYADRQRIQSELSNRGMGSMSLDQLAQSQNQTILNWQLAHSILQRIEEILAEAQVAPAPKV